jgi:predicted RNA binding protein YcfA (HicA-like mRNA interferase family)
MTRLAPLPSATVKQILKRNGLRHVRTAPHGELWVHPADPSRRTTVPERPRIVIDTLRRTISQAGKSRDELAG